MQDLFREKYKFLSIPLILGSLVATVYLIQIVASFLSQFAEVFAILFIAWIISTVLRPVVQNLHQKGVSYTAGAAIAFCIFFLAITVFFVYMIPQILNELGNIKNVISFVQFSPQAQATLAQYHINIHHLLGPILTDPLQEVITFLTANSFSTIGALLNALFVLALSFFFAFFLMQGGGKLNKSIVMFIPKEFRNDYIIITKSLDTGLSTFIRGQVVISLIYAAIVMLVMRLVGLHFVLVAGIYSFVAFLVPLFGAGLALLLPLIIAVVSSFPAFIVLSVILIVVQQILLNFIMPKIYSKDMGIHPAVVVLAILIGYQLSGIVGLILALPIASVIQSLLKYYFFSIER